MPLLGSHLSISGGYHRAVYAAAELEMDCVQIFTKNNNQWRAKPLLPDEVHRFQLALGETGISHPLSHDSYLINLGTSDEVLWNKSIDALVIELQRAAALTIPHVVVHPGAHVGAGEAVGIARIALGLDFVLDRTSQLETTVALETTAGQGSYLGYRFEHLAGIIERCSRPERLTICLDTCHIFAAGYPLAPKSKYNQTIREFDRKVGLDRLVAIHLNDSKREQGSRVDRHEHIGRGRLGSEPFGYLLNDRRFQDTPMYLETPKKIDPDSGKPWDAVNLACLRGLLQV